jgi:ketosteroid isomerase-like protein
MSSGADVAERFYAAFARRDHATMAACYAPGARFSDPVFPALRGERIGLMWRMLCERGTDLRVEWTVLQSPDDRALVAWQAWYTFRATGRPVHNRITATMTLEHGLIRRHRDDFAFHRWAAQALGWKGWLLGWTPLVRNAVRREAARALEQFAGG